MAARKDDKGRALRKGETLRKDGRYTYVYEDPNGVRRCIYAKDLKRNSGSAIDNMPYSFFPYFYCFSLFPVEILRA